MRGPLGRPTYRSIMQSRRVSWILVLATLLACQPGRAKRAESVQPAEDRIEEVEAASYSGPPVPSIRLEPGTGTGALVGAVYGCDGRPLPAVHITAWQASDTGRHTDTLVQEFDPTFILRSLRPGEWRLRFSVIGHQSRLLPVSVQADRVDTLMVQLSMTQLGVIRDCVCANGRDFGGHCCKGMTIRVCTPTEPRTRAQ
jgi:hypothetical protein